MKLANFYHNGSITPGIIRDNSLIPLLDFKNIPKNIEQIISNYLSLKPILQKIHDNTQDKQTLDIDDIKFSFPITNPKKIICVGLNYHNHVEETKYCKTDFPTLFPRYPSSYVAYNDYIIKTKRSDKLDYEGELAIIINNRCKNIRKEDAKNYIAGYSIFNDCTIRDYQAKTSQWLIGKNFDKCGSFGPYIVTLDDLPNNGSSLELKTYVNNQLVQNDNTANMIFSPYELIEKITQIMTLETGDIILTGTPSGSGFSRSPKLFLKDGDSCRVEIESIGSLCNIIKEE